MFWGATSIMDSDGKTEALPVSKKGGSEKIVFAALVLAVILVFGGMVYFFGFKPASSPDGFAAINPGESKNLGGSANANEGVAATVNGEKILLSEVEKRFKTVPVSLAGQVTKTSILENMIDGKLIFLEAQKNGVTVDENEIENVVTQQKSAVDEIIKLGGFSEQEVKDSIKESLVVQKFLNEKVFAKIEVTDKEISDYYEQNKESFKEASAAHILVADEAKAKDLLAKLKAGEDFAKLAKENSTDTGSGANGGELGFFRKSDMVQEFGDAAFALKPGELSGVVKSQYGYHIILLHEFKESLEDFKGQIKQGLQSQKTDKAYADYLAELKKKAKIEILFKESVVAQ